MRARGFSNSPRWDDVRHREDTPAERIERAVQTAQINVETVNAAEAAGVLTAEQAGAMRQKQIVELAEKVKTQHKSHAAPVAGCDWCVASEIEAGR